MRLLMKSIYLTAALMMVTGPAAAEIVADNVKCVECINQIDIHRGAVAKRHLRTGSVTPDAIQDGAVDWQKLAVSLQDRTRDLETRLAALEDNSVLALDGYLSLDVDDPQKPTARFAGMNVQIVNGSSFSRQINGVGNLLIGYDEAPKSTFPICSDGQYQDEAECISAGGIWASDHKSGSHNLVIGAMHRYSAYGGFLAGFNNASSAAYGSVSGGIGNLASERWSSICGGEANVAQADWSAVSGGLANTAGEIYSVVSGGSRNVTSGTLSVVSGGYFNTAGGEHSVVSGGHKNISDGNRSVVSGGYENTSNSNESVVSGGFGNEANNTYSVVSSGSGNAADGMYSVVSGGGDNTATGTWSVVSGGYLRQAEGAYDWVGGSLSSTD